MGLDCAEAASEAISCSTARKDARSDMVNGTLFFRLVVNLTSLSEREIRVDGADHRY